MPDEGPAAGLNVTAPIGGSIAKTELAILRSALGDDAARRQLRQCRGLLDDLATRLTSEELLRELSGIPFPSGQNIEQLSNSVFWFTLAASLDSREHGPCSRIRYATRYGNPRTRNCRLGNLPRRATPISSCAMIRSMVWTTASNNLTPHPGRRSSYHRTASPSSSEAGALIVRGFTDRVSPSRSVV